MKLHSIRLKHANHFADLQANFHYHDQPITLILGDQGVGKTTLLKHCYQALSWFSARLKDARGAGVIMLDQDIMQTRIQSKIDIQVRIPSELGQLPESADVTVQDSSLCRWQLYKTLNANSSGLSKAETAELEQLIELYQQAIKQDPLQGLPVIAYYPAERFVNEVNLLSKNNPMVFHASSAYEQSAISFTTFARFFEWLREVSDVENAQTAQLLQQFLTHAQDKNSSFDLVQAHAQIHSPALTALKTALHTVFPEISDFYLQYHPKLQLMVQYESKTMLYQQLPNTVKNWIALIGDLVRRLCLLNPLSLYPCQEGDGIVLIDHVDAHLDQNLSQVILQRLHQAFPQLQLIVTGNRSELLEDAARYQCLRLEHQTLHPVHSPQTWEAFDHLYTCLGISTDQPEPLESLKPPVPPVDPEQVRQLFQQLTVEQQSALLQQLQVDSDPSNPETSL